MRDQAALLPIVLMCIDCTFLELNIPDLSITKYEFSTSLGAVHVHLK